MAITKNVFVPASKIKRKYISSLIPVFGIILFIIFYIIATMLYPGGSQVDAHAKGFSWINNYWCNLLNEKAINGAHNAARPVALTGMAILCFSLCFFWYVFPLHVELKKYHRLIIQFAGMLSMVISMFLFTALHDVIVNMAGIFGVAALCAVFVALNKNRLYGLLIFGTFNMLLVILNNYIYYSKDLIIYLPVVQKISFVSFLLWICCIQIFLYRKAK